MVKRRYGVTTFQFLYNYSNYVPPGVWTYGSSVVGRIFLDQHSSSVKLRNVVPGPPIHSVQYRFPTE
jgi:hypothetical protein